ncbi:MAG: hypothetical protein WBD40_14505 [Tepidisphaeraceae bacterium]
MNDDGSPTMATAQAHSIRTGGTNDAPPKPPRVPLGAELPLFCERCGYSLNALPQVQCEHCSILQFHCPECGHHQPINTLRPAMQRTLGRLRAFSLGLLVFFKLNWFGWLLFAWLAMGVEWSYGYNRRSNNYGPIEITLELVICFLLFGVPFGAFSRLLLLRWRSGALVGVVLASLTCTILYFGFHWGVSMRSRYDEALSPGQVLTLHRALIMLMTFAIIAGAAAAAWTVWSAFVRLVLPDRAGRALLEWQASLSEREPQVRLSDQP